MRRSYFQRLNSLAPPSSDAAGHQDVRIRHAHFSVALSEAPIARLTRDLATATAALAAAQRQVNDLERALSIERIPLEIYSRPSDSVAPILPTAAPPSRALPLDAASASAPSAHDPSTASSPVPPPSPLQALARFVSACRKTLRPSRSCAPHLPPPVRSTPQRFPLSAVTDVRVFRLISQPVPPPAPAPPLPVPCWGSCLMMPQVS